MRLAKRVYGVPMSAYQELRAQRATQVAEQSRGSSPRAVYSPEVAAARAAERNRRNAEARRRAGSVLAALHAEEFERLLQDERRALDAERGPLPGDPDA